MSDKKSNLPSNLDEIADAMLHKKIVQLVHDIQLEVKLSGTEAMALVTTKPKNRFAIEDGKLIIQINFAAKIKVFAFLGSFIAGLWALVSFLVNNWDTINKLIHR